MLVFILVIRAPCARNSERAGWSVGGYWSIEQVTVPSLESVIWSFISNVFLISYNSW